MIKFQQFAVIAIYTAGIVSVLIFDDWTLISLLLYINLMDILIRYLIMRWFK